MSNLLPHPLLLLLLSLGVGGEEGRNVRVDSLPLLLVLEPSRGSAALVHVCAAVAHHGGVYRAIELVISGGTKWSAVCNSVGGGILTQVPAALLINSNI